MIQHNSASELKPADDWLNLPTTRNANPFG
jgi:hypothetical protein